LPPSSAEARGAVEGVEMGFSGSAGIQKTSEALAEKEEVVVHLALEARREEEGQEEAAGDLRGWWRQA